LPKVEFIPSSRKVTARKGETIFNIAREAGVHLNSSCNGLGTCGKCKVRVVEGEVAETLSSYALSEDLREKGYRLACQLKVLGDCKIFVPPETRLLGHEVLEERGETRLAEELKEKKINPRFRKIFLKLPPPSLEDNLSDWERVKREIKKNYPEKEVAPPFFITLKSLPFLLRQSKWEVTATLFLKGNINFVTNLIAGKKAFGPFALVVDVGTTTLIVELVELSSGSVWGRESRYNPQIAYGEDVISRMVYGKKESGLKKLQREVIRAIEQMGKKLLEEASVKAEEVCGIYLAGNTIMLHLLSAVYPGYIQEEPYVPATNFGCWERGESLGFIFFEKSYVFLLPCVASFMGADVVAGLLASGFYKKGPLRLFIDVGTNGEIVLGNGDWFLGCSCSAGPAFEGGGVKHGTRVVPGAIEEVKIDPESFDLELVTVGDAPPVGICGSGLIDLLAELYLSGLIDRRGKFIFSHKTERLRKSNGDYEFVIYKGENRTKDITITESDIDNLMRAKAALFAGIKLLVETAEVSFKDIEKIYLAGGFGNFIDAHKAVIIGLLPDVPLEKIEFLGNTSLLGARLVAFNKEFEEMALEIASRVTYLELARSGKFMDEYVSALFLPHTHTELFPSVSQLLKRERKVSKK